MDNAIRHVVIFNPGILRLEPNHAPAVSMRGTLLRPGADLADGLVLHDSVAIGRIAGSKDGSISPLPLLPEVQAEFQTVASANPGDSRTLPLPGSRSFDPGKRPPDRRDRGIAADRHDRGSGGRGVRTGQSNRASLLRTDHVPPRSELSLAVLGCAHFRVF